MPAAMCTTRSAAKVGEGRSPTSRVSRSNTSGMELTCDDLNGASATIDGDELAGLQAPGRVAEQDDALWHREARAQEVAQIRGFGTDSFAICLGDVGEANDGARRRPSGHFQATRPCITMSIVAGRNGSGGVPDR